MEEKMRRIELKKGVVLEVSEETVDAIVAKHYGLVVEERKVEKKQIKKTGKYKLWNDKDVHALIKGIKTSGYNLKTFESVAKELDRKVTSVTSYAALLRAKKKIKV